MLQRSPSSAPGGRNPKGEGPEQLADGNHHTKWLDFNKCPLIVTFQRQVHYVASVDIDWHSNLPDENIPG